jgi:hypothetical protein
VYNAAHRGELIVETAKSEELLESVLRIYLSEDGKVLVAHLADTLTAMMTQLVSIKDDVSIRWMQGKCVQLSEIIKLLETADKEIQLLKKYSKRPGAR